MIARERILKAFSQNATILTVEGEHVRLTIPNMRGCRAAALLLLVAAAVCRSSAGAPPATAAEKYLVVDLGDYSCVYDINDRNFVCGAISFPTATWGLGNSYTPAIWDEEGVLVWNAGGLAGLVARGINNRCDVVLGGTYPYSETQAQYFSDRVTDNLLIPPQNPPSTVNGGPTWYAGPDQGRVWDIENNMAAGRWRNTVLGSTDTGENPVFWRTSPFSQNALELPQHKGSASRKDNVGVRLNAAGFIVGQLSDYGCNSAYAKSAAVWVPSNVVPSQLFTNLPAEHRFPGDYAVTRLTDGGEACAFGITDNPNPAIIGYGKGGGRVAYLWVTTNSMTWTRVNLTNYVSGVPNIFTPIASSQPATVALDVGDGGVVVGMTFGYEISSYEESYLREPPNVRVPKIDGAYGIASIRAAGWVWDYTNNFQTLTSLLDPEYSGYTIGQAVAISRDGTIAANAIYNGIGRGVLLIPFRMEPGTTLVVQ